MYGNTTNTGDTCMFELKSVVSFNNVRAIDNFKSLQTAINNEGANTTSI